MKNVLKHVLPGPVRAFVQDKLVERRSRRTAYSQEGEDLLLVRIFESRPRGIYVDVGAHHPFRFSNTCLLHQKGWKGVNIDAMPGSMRLFNRFRPADVNLEAGISATPSTLEFFIFAEPALNTFDPALAQQRQDMGWKLASTRAVPCMPLAQVLQDALPRLGADQIDLLTIDVEGFDLDVLRSNDWRQFQPSVIAIEILDKDMTGVLASDVGRYCDSIGYTPFAKLHHTVLFMKR